MKANSGTFDKTRFIYSRLDYGWYFQNMYSVISSAAVVWRFNILELLYFSALSALHAMQLDFMAPLLSTNESSVNKLLHLVHFFGRSLGHLAARRA